MGQDSSSSRDDAAGEEPRPTPPAGQPPTRDASQPSPGGDGLGDAAEVERDLDSLLAEAQSQRDEYLELAKRTKADFENYRKRMAAEVQAAAMRGKSEAAQGLIDAVDNLERALEAKGDSPDDLAAGVEMVLRGLREGLSRLGIEPVDPSGEKFDPNLHEALSTAPSSTVESGHVVEVLQKGYRLDEHLIRPARVVVSE